ncbi:hypothetical protein SDRG_04102 [Saprolegnia diclina VS20]|uniref:Leucine-rich repeat-containing N-terminal plant-type domain-containing protein n=1 Tax=Saprolegnia diclina (strain VS20) TaxID=1156394 RepID=T0QUN3_SAPDV|nr:hypothetical protein SDRG_04102 [Saprolegnia diclina VS20]EQC38391.1 hypothetical protein SDRG_04102 [Saprolegnia diclina VS20]|eukprot:XP_008607983.1 hypothetical protein SDRG_04102 [Saprolegnia diclina VS20]
MQWFLALFLPVAVLGAVCPYHNYTAGNILVADELCSPSAPICSVNTSCTRSTQQVPQDATNLAGFIGLGNLTMYPYQGLVLYNASTVWVEDLVLPASLLKLGFSNISAIYLDEFAPATIAHLTAMAFITCNLGVIPLNFQWPPGLQELILVNNAFQTIPKALPMTLHTLAFQANALSDLFYLPANLTYLDLDLNLLEEVVDRNWNQLTHVCVCIDLRLNNNPIATIAGVHLSKSLKFFGCKDCPLTNFTMTPDTFAALDELQPWNGKSNYLDSKGFHITRDVSMDPSACGAIDGSVQTLWAGKTNVTVRVCVTSPPSSERTSMSLPALNDDKSAFS